MTDTWGIPGPAFAGIYLFLILTPIALAAIQLHRARAGKPVDAPLSRIAEVALLAGGPVRVVDTVIAQLLQREQLRMDSAGRLHRTTLEPADELGRAAAEFVRRHGSSPDGMRWGLRENSAVVALVDELTERGLMVDPRRVRQPWRVAALAYGVLLVLGIARLASSGNHPVGYLMGLLLATVVLLVLTCVRAAATPAPAPTRAGKSALAGARLNGTLVDGEVGEVALEGLEHHPTQHIRLAVTSVTPTKPARSRSGSGSGWIAAGGFYGGSSCGGGGGASCGGGGGGCGGGGGGGCGG